MFTKQQLAQWESLGFKFDDFYHTQAVEEVKKKVKPLTIIYKSSSIDDKNIYLTFEITTSVLKNTTGTILIQETNATDEIAVNTKVKLLSNQKQQLKVSFDRKKQFDKYFWQNGFVYQATITCDGFSAQTDEFSLKFKKEEKPKSICERDLTVEEVKNIVKILRENTYYEAIDPKTKEKAQFPLTNLPYYSIDEIFHRNGYKINDKELKKEVVLNNSFENFTGQLNYIFNKYEINNCNRRCHFLSQIFVETENFTKTIESDNKYIDYDPLRGRGFIHLTLKDNYKKYSNYKKEIDKIEIDFEKNYSLISTNLEYAADASGWYWRFGSVKGDINPIADFGDVKKVTPYINSASLELEKRENAFELLKKIFKNENS